MAVDGGAASDGSPGTASDGSTGTAGGGVPGGSNAGAATPTTGSGGCQFSPRGGEAVGYEWAIPGVLGWFLLRRRER